MPQKLTLNKVFKLLLKQVVNKLTMPSPIIEIIVGTLVDVITLETSTIDSKLDSLIGKYYKTGLDYLNDARIVTDEKRTKWIEQALHQFIQAANIQDVLMAFKSEVFVAVCYDLLFEDQAALNWYERAYTSAYTFQGELLKQTWDPYRPDEVSEFATAGAKIGPQALGYGLLGTLVGGAAGRATGALIGLPVKAVHVQQQNKAREELIEFHSSFMQPLKELLLARSSTLDILHKELYEPPVRTFFPPQMIATAGQLSDEAKEKLNSVVETAGKWSKETKEKLNKVKKELK